MAPLRFESGQRFASFVIDQRIGEGGMGEVYEATHVHLHKKFALKILHPNFNQDPTFAARFQREMVTVSSLNHPNIVTAADGGSTEGHNWFSMTFVSGTDAQKASSAKPGGMPAARAVNIIEKVAAALDYAHRRHVLHRDIKPANILLAADPDFDEERVYLTDFGIAKVIGESTLTMDGQLLLSIDYAPPEQIDGRPLDSRADIYSLGATLFTLLTGQVPFQGDSWPVKVNKRFQHPLPQPSAVAADLPAGLDAVVGKALSIDPELRYQSCRELAEDARSALTATSVTEASAAVTSAESIARATRSAPTQPALATPTVLEPGPDEQRTIPSGPPGPTRHRVRSTVLIAAVVAVVAVSIGWLIASQSRTGQSSSNDPITASSDAQGPNPAVQSTASPAQTTALSKPETAQASGPATTRPLSELLDPAVERQTGLAAGQVLAEGPGYSMTPKGCPTSTRQVTADLGGGYASVTANLALDDAAPASTRTSVVVVADGQELSRKILSPTEGTSWDLPVQGAASLVITIETLGQGSCTADGYFVYITDAVALAA